MADEALRLKLQVDGQPQVVQAQAAVDKLKTTVVATTQATAASTATTTANTAATNANTTATTTSTTATKAQATVTATATTATTAASAATTQATTATQGNTAATAANTQATAANTAAATTSATATTASAAATATAAASARAAATSTTSVNAAMGRTAASSASAKSGMQSLGMTMLTVGNMADDIQYGFRGIVNNIPMLVMGLGGGMGLAGAAVIAGVAINQFSGKIAEAFDWTKQYRSELAKTTDEMKKMTEGTTHQVIAQARFERDQNNRESGASFFKTVGLGQGKSEQSLSAAMGESVRSFRDPDAQRAVIGEELGRSLSTDKQLRKLRNAQVTLKQSDSGGLAGDILRANLLEGPGGIEARIQERTKAVSENVKARIDRIMKGIEEGTEEGVQAGIKLMRNAGRFDLADEMEKDLGEWIKEKNRSIEMIYLGEFRKMTKSEERNIGYIEDAAANIVGSTMKRFGNAMEQAMAEERLIALGVPTARVQQLVEAQQRQLANVHAAKLAELIGQGYTGDQAKRMIEIQSRNSTTDQGYTQEEIEGKIKQASKTDKEREEDEKLSKRISRAQDISRQRLDHGREVGQQVMGPGGTFTDSAQAAITAAVGGDAEAAFMVMDELSKKQKERIDLLKEEMKAQGFSNAEIEKAVELQTRPKKELEREQRLLGQTGFNIQGVGNDILALTRSRAQGGMGLSLDQAQAFEKQQLTDAMVMQGFSKTDAGKMADTLVRDSETGVKNAMEDLARTMPDSIQGMKDLMREQMAAAERLERNGIRMVLGRR